MHIYPSKILKKDDMHVHYNIWKTINYAFNIHMSRNFSTSWNISMPLITSIQCLYRKLPRLTSRLLLIDLYILHSWLRTQLAIISQWWNKEAVWLMHKQQDYCVNYAYNITTPSRFFLVWVFFFIWSPLRSDGSQVAVYYLV